MPVAVCVVDIVGAIVGGDTVQSIELQFATKSKQKFSQTWKLLMLYEVDPLCRPSIVSLI